MSRTNKSILFYPPGAGGHWVQHLLHCLITQQKITNTNINYHDTNIVCVAYDNHWTYKKSRFACTINDDCLFNFYINYVEKIIETEITPDDKQRFWAAYLTLEKIFLFHKQSTKNRMIKYTNIWKDTQEFIRHFERAFAGTIYEIHNIKALWSDVNNNQEIFEYKIKEYKSSVADPTDYYNQPDNFYWKVWCFFLMLKFGQTTIDIHSIKKDEIEIMNDTVSKQNTDQILSITDDLIYFYPK